MKENFTLASDLLFELEGYKSDIKEDRGGKTIWGITEKWYPDIVAKMVKMTPEITKEAARQFYKSEYWNPHKLDDIDYPLDIIAFCMIVNSHKEGEELLSQIVLDLHPVCEDWRKYLFKFLCFYIDIWRKTPTNAKFLYGWKNRVNILWDKFDKEELARGM